MLRALLESILAAKRKTLSTRISKLSMTGQTGVTINDGVPADFQKFQNGFCLYFEHILSRAGEIEKSMLQIIELKLVKSVSSFLGHGQNSMI